jgi:hypothetical protein
MFIFLSTNSQDQIYALLGLVKGGFSVVIVPDNNKAACFAYDQALLSIYANLTDQLLQLNVKESWKVDIVEKVRNYLENTPHKTIVILHAMYMIVPYIHCI